MTAIMTVRVSRPLLKAELDAVNKLITPADETERSFHPASKCAGVA